MTQPTPIEFNWCLPVSGDGHQLQLHSWQTQPSLESAVDLFETAADQGFRYLLVGMGFNNHKFEAWTYSSAILAKAKRGAALIAVRPGFFSAPVFAKMATTLDHLSQGRLAFNIVTGGRPGEQAMYGDQLEHDARYRRTAEFMTLCRRLWSSQEPLHFHGEFNSLRKCSIELPPLQPNGPPLYLGGASPAAETVAAKHSDCYLLWGETLAQTRDRLRRMKWLVAQEGRAGSVRFGLRINIISRDTEKQAREAAEYLIAPIPKEHIQKFMRRDLDATGRDSIGQRRQWDLTRQADKDWYVEPLLWSGISLVRSGAGMAIVGSHAQVAQRLKDYADIGVNVFILSGYPHHQECINVGQNVIPRFLALT